MNSVKRRGGGKPNRGGGRGNHRGRPPPPRKTSDPPSQNGAMSRKGMFIYVAVLTRYFFMIGQFKKYGYNFICTNVFFL